MKRSNAILFGVICVGLMVPRSTMAAETSSSPELLGQYVAELQKAPEDQALRERIIRLERTLRPSPEVSVVARRLFVTATTFEMEAAHIRGNDALAISAREFAISAYKEALLIAPWWADAYFGLSRSLEASGRFHEAVAAMNLYVITEPDRAGANAAEERLCAIANALQRDQVPIKR
jgi:tetratricopeptide (TPR) repeat protein